MTEEERYAARFCELAEACYAKGRYTFTDFLGLAETDLFFRTLPSFSYVPYTLFGGATGCERVMARFGDEASLGYAPPPFPIACLAITPAAPKFAEPLSHRDCLGALMNLGIKRECLGDISQTETGFFLFAEEKLAQHIGENLTRIRHTAVHVAPCTAPATVLQRSERIVIQVSAPRADAVLARAYRLSREESAALFSSRLVFVNGRLCSQPSLSLREGDMLTARGYGRLRYVGAESLSRKGKQNTVIEKFI